MLARRRHRRVPDQHRSKPTERTDPEAAPRHVQRETADASGRAERGKSCHESRPSSSCSSPSPPLCSAPSVTNIRSTRRSPGARRVTIDHRFGRLNLHTTSGNEVNVQGVVRSSDPEFGKTDPLQRLRVGRRSHHPHRRPRGALAGESVLLDRHRGLRPGDRTAFDLQPIGSIIGSGVRAASEFSNAQGSIELSGHPQGKRSASRTPSDR